MHLDFWRVVLWWGFFCVLGPQRETSGDRCNGKFHFRGRMDLGRGEEAKVWDLHHFLHQVLHHFFPKTVGFCSQLDRLADVAKAAKVSEGYAKARSAKWKGYCESQVSNDGPHDEFQSCRINRWPFYTIYDFAPPSHMLWHFNVWWWGAKIATWITCWLLQYFTLRGKLG